jgi:hypothetical protein
MFETQCSSYLSTTSIFESKCRSNNHKGTGVSGGCTFVVDIFSETTTAQDSRGVGCLIKAVGKTGQTGLAKSTGSRLQRRKRHRSNQNSTSQTSPLPSTSHGKCLMAKGEKKKKPTKDEREEEEDEYDLDFDKLRKKDMIKIKSLFERF